MQYLLSKLAHDYLYFVAQLINPLPRQRFVKKHDKHGKTVQREKDRRKKKKQEREGGRSDRIGGSLVWDRETVQAESERDSWMRNEKRGY